MCGKISRANYLMDRQKSKNETSPPTSAWSPHRFSQTRDQLTSQDKPRAFFPHQLQARITMIDPLFW